MRIGKTDTKTQTKYFVLCLCVIRCSLGVVLVVYEQLKRIVFFSVLLLLLSAVVNENFLYPFVIKSEIVADSSRLELNFLFFLSCV